jgi:hypothetical protein
MTGHELREDSIMRWPGFVVVAVIAIAGGVQAQGYFDENSLGLFFFDGAISEENTNIDTSTLPGPFQAYLVITNCEFFAIDAYEVGISFDDKVAVLEASGDNGWTNYGSVTNHLVTYQAPVYVDQGTAVLSTLTLLHGRSDPVNVFLGPADPSGVGGEGPAIANGADPSDWAVCSYTSDPDVHAVGHVATFNGDGIVFPYGRSTSVESRRWSDVKALF